MRHMVCGSVALCLALAAGQGFAQEQGPTVATDLTKAQIDAHLQKAVTEGISDRILSLVNVGPYNVATAVVIRRPASTGKAVGNIGGFLSHDKITEIYYIIRGSGVQVTGGTMVGGKPNAGGGATGPGVGGATKIEGGRVSNLVAGDVQIIPPGVAHGWSSVGADGIDYIVLRVDPEHVLKSATN